MKMPPFPSLITNKHAFYRDCKTGRVLYSVPSLVWELREFEQYCMNRRRESEWRERVRWFDARN